MSVRPPPHFRILPALLATGLCPVLPAADAEAPAEPADLRSALTEGTTHLAARYRAEFVDQDGVDSDAFASTLRVALSYQTRTWHDTDALIEFETTQVIGNGDLYTDPADPSPSRPVVADPEHVEVNKAWLRWRGLQGLSAKLGRQTIIHDGARFIGNVGWRQNEQTFDALRLQYSLADLPLTLEYDYLWNVNRIFSDRSRAPATAGTTGDDRMASHLLHASYVWEGWGTASAFAYLLDYDVRDGLDSSTIGARFTGKRPISDSLTAHYELALASQSDAFDNPADLSEPYANVVAGLGWRMITVTVGYELLGGDGSTAFQTPLATLHKFNGWVDRFLVTPATGLTDLSVGVSGTVPTVPGLSWALTWHDFATDEGGDDLGSEIDLLVKQPLKAIDDKLVVGLKAGFFDGPGDDDDATKIWAWVQWGF